jgi:pyrroline-5-carboxylate reductase
VHAIEGMVSSTGAHLWVAQEADLDAVTALSGSGPAYVFYFIEAMMQAAQDMGLSAEQGRLLAQATFAGATALSQQSDVSPAVLRERVTSKGGTTYAALTHLESKGVKDSFVAAMRAAQQRAAELGDEFGRTDSGPQGQIRDHAHPHREAEPVVEAESLEAAPRSRPLISV